jgi:hypothetical protein
MKCKTCGKNADSEYCFQHKSKKPLSSGKGFSSKKSSFLTKKQDKSSDNLLEMRKLFLDIWNIRPHRSEVSGDYLGAEALSTYFHHILSKSKYPEACLDAENIVLLSLLEHANVENDMYRYEEVNRRREQLKIKYNL